MQVKYIGEWLGSRHNNGGRHRKRETGTAKGGGVNIFVLPFNLKLILKAIRTAPVPYTDLPYSMFYLAAIREGNALLYLYVRGNSGGTGRRQDQRRLTAVGMVVVHWFRFVAMY